MCPQIKHRPRIIILIGPAYSGKTRWAQKFVKEAPVDSVVIIQRDGIYQSLCGERYPDDATREVAETMIEAGIARALSLGQDVILDGRNTAVDELSTIIETFTNLARIFYKVFEIEEFEFMMRRNYAHSMGEDPASIQEFTHDLYNLDLVKEQMSWYPEVSKYKAATNGSLF